MKGVLRIVAKRLPYIQDARCLKVNTRALEHYISWDRDIHLVQWLPKTSMSTAVIGYRVAALMPLICYRNLNFQCQGSFCQ